MNIRIYNARLLTMVPGSKIEENRELWVQEGKISYVGAAIPNPCSLPFDREIDAKGNLLLPGFKNAHTHSAMTFLRSYADDLPLDQWLHERVFPYEAKLTEEDAYHLNRLAMLEYLTSGITAAFDMYPFPDATARAAAACGFRTVLCSGLNNFTSSLAELEEQFQRLNQLDALISFRLGFHAEYTTSRTLLEGLSALSHQLHAPVFTHCAETKKEVESCIAHHGKTPVAYLDSLGLFDFGGGCFHCVHVTEADIKILARRGVFAVTNPASNLKLASGIAPLMRLKNGGVRLAIGTDGPASNNCLDFFREMYLCTALQKLLLSDAAAFDALDVLAMATRGGAAAMGLTNCQTLSPGQCADVIMLDLQQPNMQPVHNIEKNIVYSGSKQNVALTMIDGKILYENGTFRIGTDPQEIYAKANEIAARITQQV